MGWMGTGVRGSSRGGRGMTPTGIVGVRTPAGVDPGPPPISGSTLVWNPVPFSAGYVVEVGSAAGLSDLLVQVVGVPTINLASFLPSGTYFTRVRSVAAMGGTVVTPEENAGPPTTPDLEVTF